MFEKVHVGSAFIGILVFVVSLGAYFSYQSNAKHDEAVEKLNSMALKMEKIEKFIDQNDFVK